MPAYILCCHSDPQSCQKFLAIHAVAFRQQVSFHPGCLSWSTGGGKGCVYRDVHVSQAFPELDVAKRGTLPIPLMHENSITDVVWKA